MGIIIKDKRLRDIFAVCLSLIILTSVYIGITYKSVVVVASKGIVSLVLGNQRYTYRGETLVQEAPYGIGNVIVSYKGIPLKFDGYADAYTRIYCFGKYDRIIEISNFPRAYKDTAQHIYTSNKRFIVSEADLNYYDENGKRWYFDSRENLVALGDRATHYIGESLPGFFPMWLEYTTLQPVTKVGEFKTTFLPPEAKVVTSTLLDGANPVDLTKEECGYLDSKVAEKKFVVSGKESYGVLYIHYQYSIGQ